MAHTPHARGTARPCRVCPKEAAYALRALSGSGVALPGGSCRAAPSRELARYSRGSVVALSGSSCRAAPPRELARYSRGMYGYPRLERASRQRRSVCRTAPTAKPPQQNQCSHWSAAWRAAVHGREGTAGSGWPAPPLLGRRLLTALRCPQRHPQHAAPLCAHRVGRGRSARARLQSRGNPRVEGPAHTVAAGPRTVEWQRPEVRPPTEDLLPVGTWPEVVTCLLGVESRAVE
eukprot:scaffold114983_cov75-Phaeocystis_antarctica.AAC.2